MADSLTEPQQALVCYLETRADCGEPPPTCREICGQFGYKSPRAASDLIVALERKGYVKRDRRRARGLHLTDKGRGIPLLGRITAGHAGVASVEVSERLRLAPESFGICDRAKAFALRVTGDSMIGRQIFDGDLVLLEGDVVPQHGDVVAALIDGESTLKTLARRQNKNWLHAENPLYPDLIPAWNLHIQGVARAVFRMMST
jgi:repressor LexA